MRNSEFENWVGRFTQSAQSCSHNLLNLDATLVRAAVAMDPEFGARKVAAEGGAELVARYYRGQRQRLRQRLRSIYCYNCAGGKGGVVQGRV